jgi:anti-sigma factor RsiW
MSCNENLTLQAYFDGELDAAAALAMERHLAGCGECAALLKDLEAMRGLIRRQASYHRAGDGARAAVVKKLGEGTRAWRGFWAGAAGGAGATALAAALVVFTLLPRAEPLLDEVMNAHLHSLATGQLIEVASSDRHTVKPWFAGHTDVSPPAADFAAQGYVLVGGRMDYVNGKRAAVLVYRHGKHIINVFTWAAPDGSLPAASSRDGYRMLFWKAGDLDFAAVSDTGAAELDQLRELMVSERE